jgi:ankyrin repeat protein
MTTQAVDQELVGQFVTAAHGDAERVRALLAEHPELLNERYKKFDETALEAAAHMGNRAIAELLLAAGAPLTICAAAMLGRRDDVAAMLRGDAALARSSGAHGIALMFHAALGGDVALAELLVEHGGGEQIAGVLHGAVWYGRLEMAEWLLRHGADLGRTNFQGKTPLESARERGDAAMVALLERYGAAKAQLAAD